MLKEYFREVKRNIGAITDFYRWHGSCDYDADDKTFFGETLPFLLAPLVYTVGFFEPIVEAPVRSLSRAFRR